MEETHTEKAPEPQRGGRRKEWWYKTKTEKLTDVLMKQDVCGCGNPFKNYRYIDVNLQQTCRSCHFGKN